MGIQYHVVSDLVFCDDVIFLVFAGIKINLVNT